MSPSPGQHWATVRCPVTTSPSQRPVQTLSLGPATQNPASTGKPQSRRGLSAWGTEDAFAGLLDGILRPGLRHNKTLKATRGVWCAKRATRLVPVWPRTGSRRGQRSSSPSDPLPGLNAGAPSPGQPSHAGWGRQGGQALGKGVTSSVPGAGRAQDSAQSDTCGLRTPESGVWVAGQK